ncbi:hypothetical protein MHYP_G00185680 [Metynnis hypsauchen]
MDLKVLLLVLSITFTSVQGAVPTCCVQTSRIPLAILQEVEKYDVQNRNGVCEIDAVVLHHKGKKYCALPRAKTVLQIIHKKKMGSKYIKYMA